MGKRSGRVAYAVGYGVALAIGLPEAQNALVSTGLRA